MAGSKFLGMVVQISTFDLLYAFRSFFRRKDMASFFADSLKSIKEGLEICFENGHNRADVSLSINEP